MPPLPALNATLQRPPTAQDGIATHLPRARLAAALTAIWAAAAGAQVPAAPAGEPGVRNLPEVRITADPLAPDELRSTRPTTLLQATDLARALDTSLGGTLSQQPGVHSSGFGTAAGRPIIRGQDGARVRVVQNGLDTMDVSTLSPDHAIAADPLAADRIEILRGPATLLYGGGAVGGLVNIVSTRIPTERLGAVGGNALLTADSASRGHTAALGARGGAGGLNWTVNAFDRAAGDYRIPGQIVAGDPDTRAARLPNSFARGEGVAAGLSWVGERATLGLAHSELNNRYGIPSEADVFIRLRQQRTEALAVLEQPLPGIARIRATLADGRYRHDEVEGSGEVGTAFRNAGREARLEITHLPMAGVRGVIGLQNRDRSLAASGEEAYIPNARDRNDAVFYAGETTIGAARIDFGWRHERARLRPQGDSTLPGRDYALGALSLGASVPVAPGWVVAGNLSTSQRAPVIEELYAHGPHVATGTFEIGDAGLQRERSLNLDIALRKTSGALRWKVGVYANRFNNYVYGRGTDENRDGIADRVDAENTLTNSTAEPLAGDFTRLTYAQGRARFTGLEGELTYRVPDSPYRLRLFGDVARGQITDQGQVPRLAPMRIGASVDFDQARWSGFASLLSVQGQNRLAALETATPGYLKLDAELAYRLGDHTATSATLFVQGRNLLNETIRPHTSFVKDIVPQPGRSVLAGIRARF